MKISGGVEWAVHCCVVLTGMDQPVPAAKLAALHDVSATYLAKQMQALARAGLVHSVQGNSGGYLLTRSPAEITVLDVVQAIDGVKPAFTCTEIRQRGPLGTPPEQCTGPCPVNRVMMRAEQAYREALREISIADLAAEVNAGGDALTPIRTWMRG